MTEQTVCAWPRAGERRRANSDTTKTNMGRRQMPRCSVPTCRLRVDAKGDELCRLCRRRAR